MDLMILAGILAALLLVSAGFTYLLYVRMRTLQRELESMRLRVELHDDELEQIETSLSGVEL